MNLFPKLQKHCLMVFLGAGVFFAKPALASSASILNLNDQDFESLSEELSSNFMYRSVLGAAPLGEIFGVEVGLIGGSQSSSALDRISKSSGGTGVSHIYHAGLVAAISIPLGFTFEAVVFPKTTLGDLDISATNLAAKWTMNTDVLSIIPFNLALRGFVGNSKMSFSQTIPNVGSAKVDSEFQNTGLQVLASPRLPLVEPYAGIGLVNAKTSIGSDQGSIFSDASASKDKKLSSNEFILGVNANILVFHLGAEYTTAFGQSAYTLKLGFGF